MAMPIIPILHAVAPMVVQALGKKISLPPDTIQHMTAAVTQLGEDDVQALDEAAFTAMLTAVQQSDAQQIKLNSLDAVSARFWQAGWRPFIGWVCGLAFCWHFLLGPVVQMTAVILGVVVPWPSFDMATLNTTLFGLLGLGAMRSYEKVNKLVK